MAKIGKLTGNLTVEHPLFPELKVYCRILDPVEAMDVFSAFQEYQTVVAVVHPISKELIRNEKGVLETVTITNVPAKVIIDVLDNVIDWGGGGWEGLEGPDGIIVPKSENIKYLFSRDLNIPTSKLVDGVEIKSTQSFPDHIQEQLNTDVEKSIHKEEADAPKTKTSHKRRS
jgi:hypothetical protein